MPEQNVPATAIDRAPDEQASTIAVRDLEQAELVFEAYNRLQMQNEALVAELTEIKGSSEAARAQLIKPYAWAVLAFMCVYGAVAAMILLLQGFKFGKFELDNTVLGVLVGSTAVAAIGLVHTVVKGLFPAEKS